MAQPAPNSSDPNLQASVCKSTPNGLQDLNSKIAQCTSTTEQKRNNNFATSTFNLQKDIESLSGSVGDSLMMGDTMFGQFGHQDMANHVKDRYEELKAKKEALLRDVEKNEATIERSNRDFTDVKDTIKEPQSTRVLRFIEDYTLAFLIIAYIFMIISVIYIYTASSELKLVGFGKIFIGSCLLTMFMFMLLYYVT